MDATYAMSGTPCNASVVQVGQGGPLWSPIEWPPIHNPRGVSNMSFPLPLSRLSSSIGAQKSLKWKMMHILLTPRLVSPS